MPLRAARTKVMEPVEWAFPPQPLARREIISREPAVATDDRPPLLFVHGHGHGAWCFDEHWLPEAADQGWAAHAVSLRGHGQSEGHGGRWGFRDYVHDVLQAIIELPRPPVVIGHSMGALVVQRVLERYPAAPGAVLLAPAGTPRQGLETGLRVAARDVPRGLRFLAGRPITLTAEELFGPHMDPVSARRHENRQVAESPLAQYQIVLPRRPRTAGCPVLVLGGAEDRIVSVSEVVRTARHYGTRAHVFREMGHDLMLDVGWRAPLQHVLDFAAGLPRR
jgi:pimeloyl-ACP methyl ester carboxylesterase